MSVNSFGSRSNLVVGEKSYDYFDIKKVEGSADLPFSLKVLLENLLRTEDGANITAEDIRTLGQWDPSAEPSKEIQFTPARVIMQDLTGVPCIVDLATMRNAMEQLGQDPGKINPLSPAEMVIDHSVIADCFGHEEAFRQNVELEFERNAERYKFLRWGQDAINNFKIVPPDQGIVHQINIERLARVVFDKEVDGTHVAYCDTCVGTDSHTTMVNGLGVVGWGVGGIEAEAAMLGQPISMLIPRVVGFKLTGKLPEGCTATDLVLTITELLRQHKVVGKFVEFYGEGVSELPLANRATIGNMSPEYGSTIAVFPIDERTTEYLRLTGRDEEQVALVEAYAKAQGLWLDPAAEPRFSEKLELDLGTVIPSIAGPKRPQDRIKLSESQTAFQRDVQSYTDDPAKKVPVTLADGTSFEFAHGMLGVAAITSCTNTSNPSVMLGAGLVAKKAADLGLTRKPWVKTTLGPGSKVATEYLAKAGLLSSLEAIDFDVVGYGCTICIGNTGPLVPEVSQAINEHNLTATAVLSGNRNFEGRISPDVKMNYLASPMLVIVYALAGTMDIDLYNDPIGQGKDGQDVYMRDIWPTQAEIDECEARTVTSDLFKKVYIDVFAGGTEWQQLDTPEGETFAWNEDSTYVRRGPYFDDMPLEPKPVTDIHSARALLKLGDSVTTDHISPASSIPANSPAAKYLTEHGVERKDFNSYGSRRGNHEVMVRGTFANIRLRNQIAPGTEGGYTRDFTLADGPVTTVYEASMNYQAQGTPLVVLAGKEYGTGSSRDWAAKGTMLLGIKAAIAESFERIHRSNLIGMGVMPLQFPEGETADSLGLSGEESFDILGIEQLNEHVTPKTLRVIATKPDGSTVEFDATVRIDTPGEADYYRNGGILQFVLRNLAK